MYNQFLVSIVPKDTTMPTRTSIITAALDKFPSDKIASMTNDDTWLCDFMDIKLPKHSCTSPRVRKRSFAPWKVWQRHWCSVRKLGHGFGLEVLLDCGVGNSGLMFPNDKENYIRIPANAIICRTESKTKQYAFGIFPAKERKPILYLASNSESDTQRWMSKLRQQLRPRLHRFMDGTFSVSMVDNAHSRSAGLTGLYGDLMASPSGIIIKDVNTGQLLETFDWTEMSEFHLVSCGLPEDVKRTIVIHTTKEFRGGIGELKIFCLDAPKLLQELVTRGRGQKTMEHVRPLRPLSFSEGDLRLSQNEIDNTDLQVIKHKTAANISKSAGLGLLMCTRTNSEAKLISEKSINTALEKMTSRFGMRKRAMSNNYQPPPAPEIIPDATSSLEELEEPSLRRISNISNISGIYEEIADDYIPKERNDFSHLYENADQLIINYSIKLEPPPLPPRQRSGSSSTRTESISDDGMDSEFDLRSLTTPTPEENSLPKVHFLNTSDYAMMLPRAQDLLYEYISEERKNESIYMIMR